MCSGVQQYCLRWNNHRSNLLSVFDQLLQNESFTDVTLACEGGASIKGHKMVLAACSGYFAALFKELPCKHPVVVLKDVRYGDMKAILEYMYRGEVNIQQEQLAALLKVAETLKVKGLVEENAGYVNNNSKEEPDRDRASSPASPQSISTSTSPPHSTFNKTGAYGHPPHMRLSMPLWHVAAAAAGGQNSSTPLAHQLPPPPPPPPSTQSQPQGQTSSNQLMYENAIPPLRRKMLSNLMLSRDTPILRTVLGQSQAPQASQSHSPSAERSQQTADSSQASHLLCHTESADPRNTPRIHSNGSTQDSDKMRTHDSTFDDDISPYTDISMQDEDSDKKIIMTPSSSPQSYAADFRGVTSFVTPHQKPEWKRYKQYTRTDILNAIEAVRTGMSANQASTMYGVPSRTLYDKVKKLGITKNRPVKRASTGGNGVGTPSGGTPSRCGTNGFVPPYIIASDAMRRHYLADSGEESVAAAAAAVEHWIDGNAAAAAAAAAVAAQVAAHVRSRSLSPGVGCPSAPKYMRTPEDDADEQDEVEDLSVSRKQSQTPPPAPVQPSTSPHPMQHPSSPHSMQRSTSPHSMQRSISPHSMQRSTSPHPMQRSTSPHPMQRSTSPHPMQRSTSPHPMQRSTSPHPMQRSTSPHPMQRSTSPHPMQRSTSPHPMQRSTSPHPMQRPTSPHPMQLPLSPHPMQPSMSSHTMQPAISPHPMQAPISPHPMQPPISSHSMQPPISSHAMQHPLASRVIVSMHAARQEEEREREREMERERERERDREREREREREQDMGLREQSRVPIIVEDPRANPMEVGGERD